MSEYDRAINCIHKHVDDIIKEYDKMVKKVYITEENRETIRGKYFNLAYVIHDNKIDDITQILIKHCCNNHT